MFTLDHVVPWGRSFDEYSRMFALGGRDFSLRILGCGDGPASFNAEATRRGAAVISCDPIYRLEAVQIRERIGATYDEIIDQTRRNIDEFVWDTIPSVDELGRVRLAAMEEFLDDYGRGKAEGAFSWMKNSTERRSRSFAGLRTKFGSFRYSRWAASAHRTSIAALSSFALQATKSLSRMCLTSSDEAAIR